ncbi:hypothetical protein PRZ48_012306 [Zasmidium cellare]|uniref:Uncharacterized protein n=1 Tax=Zasmidium cellare TaxID=395010 RepID=A0ABR0E522_ZASCE|nr:hypothetical protein PRZ48_012306 [Zasmidium cellare]
MATTSRLRKAFRYPSEDDDSNSDLDEEHQEKLIEDLQTQDAASNDLYRKAFISIPLSGALFFLYSLLIASKTAQQRLLALLSLTSLLCTAYILHFQPLQRPDRKGKKAVYKIEAEKGPLETYLIPLNAGLVGLLQLAAVLSWSRGEAEAAWRQSLPALIYGLSMFVRWQLAPVDLEELKGARYELKGA